MSTYLWFQLGSYGAVAVCAGIGWLSRQAWRPHRHDGYVSVSGYAWACATCGKLPDGAYHAGPHGMEESGSI